MAATCMLLHFRHNVHRTSSSRASLNCSMIDILPPPRTSWLKRRQTSKVARTRILRPQIHAMSSRPTSKAALQNVDDVVLWWGSLNEMKTTNRIWTACLTSVMMIYSRHNGSRKFKTKEWKEISSRVGSGVGVEPGAESLDNRSEFPGYRKSEEESHGASHSLPDSESVRLLGEFRGCVDAKERNSNRRKGNKKPRGAPRSRIPKRERKKKKGSPRNSTRLRARRGHHWKFCQIAIGNNRRLKGTEEESKHKDLRVQRWGLDHL
ncbi:hypothetical protein B0H13DRAFT_1853658 [Mycena leptocephala]|nr:hypothetical protein B0H13DRAFT_1853658 [Mycena leptocephala]